jgi:tetratricopeptide (TPR) repeat protein
LITLDPEDEESRLLLAELYDEIGKPAEAFQHLQQITGRNDLVAAMTFRLGQRLLHTGMNDQAETCFLKHVALKADAAHAWQFLGEIALKRDQVEQSFERYSRALGINRNEVPVWRPLAGRFLQQGDPAHAVACLENLGDVPRYLPETWRDFLTAYRLAGQAATFLERIERWMNDGWAAGRYWVELADLYRECGMTERADACLARAQSGDLDIGAELALARQALDRKDGQAALQHLERVRFLAGEDALYWLTRGEALYLLSRYDEARESYERVLERDERHFRAWFHLGNIHYRAKRLVDAELAFRKAVNLEPDQAKAWYNLGCVEDEQGRNALASFSKANKLDRRFAPSWNALGVLHFRRGDDRLARRCFLRCLGCNRESLLGWENLAAVYRRTARTADAEYCEQRLLRLGGEIKRGEGQSVRLFFDHDPQSK